MSRNPIGQIGAVPNLEKLANTLLCRPERSEGSECGGLDIELL